MTTFSYHPDLIQRYPSLISAVILARDVHANETRPELQAAFLREQQAVLQRIGSTPLSEIPSLAAWRAVFRSFGVDPTQYRSAPESLLRRLTKKGDIPSINTIVDMGNLVSIRYGLPIAVFDTRSIQGTLTVRQAAGTERFINLNGAEEENPEPGEVIFVDDANIVYARRWCWRQSDQSAARPDTTSAIVTIEAHHAAAQSDVQNALTDLRSFFEHYAAGTYVQAILNAENASI
jgi:DNA/RNA-binding domain of Phe-tRNA-synthetase-like protein